MKPFYRQPSSYRQSTVMTAQGGVLPSTVNRLYMIGGVGDGSSLGKEEGVTVTPSQTPEAKHKATCCTSRTVAFIRGLLTNSIERSVHGGERTLFSFWRKIGSSIWRGVRVTNLFQISFRFRIL